MRCVVVNPPATRRIVDGLRRATGFSDWGEFETLLLDDWAARGE